MSSMLSSTDVAPRFSSRRESLVVPGWARSTAFLPRAKRARYQLGGHLSAHVFRLSGVVGTVAFACNRVEAGCLPSRPGRRRKGVSAKMGLTYWFLR